MNQTSIDQLLQVTAPRADHVASSALRARDAQPAFDDHLSRATAPAEPTLSDRAANEPVRPRASESSDQHAPGRTSPARRENASPLEQENGAADAAAAENAADDKASKDTSSPQPSGDASQVAGEDSKDANHKDVDLAIDEEQDPEASGPVAAVLVDQPEVSTTKQSTKSHDENGQDTSQQTAREIAPAPANTSQGDPDTHNYVLPEKWLKSQPGASGSKRGVTKTSGQEAVNSPPSDADAANNQAAAGKSHSRSTKPASHESAVVADEMVVEENADPAILGQRPAAESTKHAGSNESSPPASEESAEKTAGRNGTLNTFNRPESSAVAQTTVTAAAASTAAADVGHRAAPTDVGEDRSKPVSSPMTSRADGLLHSFHKLHHSGAATRGQGAAGAEELPQVDVARFVGRVARAFHTAQERGGALQLRLSPPELGALRLELVVRDGAMAATLETENATSRRLLLEHLPALRERLAEQNIRIERFDVDVRRDGSGSGQPQSGPQQQRDNQTQHAPHARHSTQQATRSENISATPAAAVHQGDSQINLIA